MNTTGNTPRAGGNFRDCDILLGKETLYHLSYTCQHTHTKYTTRPKCENTGYYGITRKGVVPCLKYAILIAEITQRSVGHDRYGSSFTYTRRGSRKAQSQATDRQALYRFGQTRGCQSGRWLPGKSGFSSSLHREKHDSKRARSRQIKKAGRIRRLTIRNSAVIRTSLKVLATARDDPRYFCATFMIHSPPSICQGMLHKNGTCSKGKSVSYVHSPHYTILQQICRASCLYFTHAWK